MAKLQKPRPLVHQPNDVLCSRFLSYKDSEPFKLLSALIRKNSTINSSGTMEFRCGFTRELEEALLEGR